jgi:hypothetical protein
MIVVSAGMQKAASATYFNLTNDLLIAAGEADVRSLRDRYGFGFFMTEVNCNVGPLRAYKLAWLSLPHWFGKSFVVKTHSPPSIYSRLCIRFGILKGTYIFRDPRDVALSVYEHGKRLRNQNFDSKTQFDTLESMEQAITFTRTLLPVWKAWTNLSGVHTVRFEDFRSNMPAQAKKLVEFLGLKLEFDQVEEIVGRYNRHGSDRGKAPASTHFHGGESGRWRKIMTESQIKLCEDAFGDYLTTMGYTN